MTNVNIEISVVDLFTEAVSGLQVFQTLAAEDIPTSTIFKIYTYNAQQTGGSFLECGTSLVEISESLGGNQIFSCTVVELLEEGEGYAMIHGKQYSIQDAVAYAELAMLEFNDRSSVDRELSKLEFEYDEITQMLLRVQTPVARITVVMLVERLAEIQRRLNIINNVRLLRQLK